MGEYVGICRVLDLERVVGELWGEFERRTEEREDVGLDLFSGSLSCRTYARYLVPPNLEYP